MRKLTLLTIVLVALFSCKKEKTTEEQTTTQPPANNNNAAIFAFDSLVPSLTVVPISKFSVVKAFTRGNGLTYTWGANSGVVTGTGNEVKYSNCHASINTITCKVKNSEGSELSKSVQIEVK